MAMATKIIPMQEHLSISCPNVSACKIPVFSHAPCLHLHGFGSCAQLRLPTLQYHNVPMGREAAGGSAPPHQLSRARSQPGPCLVTCTQRVEAIGTATTEQNGQHSACARRGRVSRSKKRLVGTARHHEHPPAGLLAPLASAHFPVPPFESRP